MAWKVAVQDRVVTGGAPVWDILSGTLLWAERGGETVHRFDPEAGRDEPLRLPQPVAAAHPRRRGGLVLTLRDGVALLDPDGTRRWLVYWAREGVGGAAATVDPAGRLWVTTSGDGALLRIEPDGEVAVVLQGVELSGFAFSPDTTTMYLAEVAAGQITAAPFDAASGALGPRDPLHAVPGGPSGLCVDAEGGLWVTSNADTADTGVHRYRPDGIPAPRLPAPRTHAGTALPTGCTFGGIGFTDLYITTTSPVGNAEPMAPVLVLPDAGEGVPLPVFAG